MKIKALKFVNGKYETYIKEISEICDTCSSTLVLVENIAVCPVCKGAYVLADEEKAECPHKNLRTLDNFCLDCGVYI